MTNSGRTANSPQIGVFTSPLSGCERGGGQYKTPLDRFARPRAGIFENPVNFFENLVGAARFELTTPSPPVKCATRLRYAPTDGQLIALKAPSDKAIPGALKGGKLGFRAFRRRQLAAHAA